MPPGWGAGWPRKKEVVNVEKEEGLTRKLDDGRFRHVPSLAVEDPEARDVDGLKVHRALLLTTPAHGRASIPQGPDAYLGAKPECGPENNRAKVLAILWADRAT